MNNILSSGCVLLCVRYCVYFTGIHVQYIVTYINIRILKCIEENNVLITVKNLYILNSQTLSFLTSFYWLWEKIIFISLIYESFEDRRKLFMPVAYQF